MKQQAITGGIAGLTDPVAKLIASLTGPASSGTVDWNSILGSSSASPALESTDPYYQYLQELGIF
jgi:hypothetical protein